MILRKTWIELRVLALVYCGLLLLDTVITIYQWPEVTRPALLRFIPTDFIRRWVEGLASFRGYIALEVFFKSSTVLGVAAAVLFGVGLVAKERENGTLEFLLTRPHSRSRVLFGKTVVAGLLVCIPLLINALAVAPLGHWLVGETVATKPLLLAAGHAMTFALAVLVVSVLCSVWCQTQAQAAFSVGALVVFQLSIYFVKGIRDFSMFRMVDFDVYGAVFGETLPARDLIARYTAWLVSAAGLLYATADRLFARRS